eukprot:scaffold111898_cov75-Phaeocystis_antarctica.AAC.1
MPVAPNGKELILTAVYHPGLGCLSHRGCTLRGPESKYDRVEDFSCHPRPLGPRLGRLAWSMSECERASA